MGSDQNILVKLNKAGFSLNNKWLVQGVSLQVEKGKIVTLIGPNGSGKSTTAKIALGIYKKITIHFINIIILNYFCACKCRN